MIRKINSSNASRYKPTTMNRKITSVLFFISLLAPVLMAAKQVPPASNTLVTDYAGILSPQEQAALERKLVAYDDSTSTQIAVVIEPSLDGDDLFDYTMRLVEAWGIGRKGKNNGILLYVAFQDRKVIIQTGYGTEGFLTDAMAKRIIETVIKPAFRQGRYYEGLDRATDVMIQLGSGEYVNDEDRSQGGGIPVGLIILIIIIILILLNRSGHDNDGGFGGGGRYDSGRRRGGGWIFLPGGGGSGWSGGGGGGFGGGGFGGFGGGGFGGGGASGGW